MSKRKRLAFGVVGVLVIGGLGLVFASNLSRRTAEVRFSPSDGGLNRLVLRAPYGSTVAVFSVVPGPEDGALYAMGSASVRSISLFDDWSARSTNYPSSGVFGSIPMDRETRVSKRLDVAATARLPEDKRRLARCGLYVLVSREPITTEAIRARVAAWK